MKSRWLMIVCVCCFCAAAQMKDTSAIVAADEYALPVNDDCADAIPLSGIVDWLPFFTAGATDDGPAPSCQSDTHRNIWYCWTAEEDGRVSVDTDWSVWDTVLTAYDGCDCSNLVELACDDDGCGIGGQSRIEFEVVGGQSYLISVGGWGTSSGGGLLNIVMASPEPMGACCVDGECIGTIPQMDCLDSGGMWAMGADCEQYACGACPEDELTISIGFDEHPEQTSWTLVDDDSGEIVGSGSYEVGDLYGMAARFCLAHDGCYSFTIFDTGGDGLTTGEYGVSGQYSLDFNGMLIAYGVDFGTMETTRLGYGCGWPTGACCLAGECIGTMIEMECESQMGTFFTGEDCDSFECPEWPGSCPETALAGQGLPAYGVGILTSDGGLGATVESRMADSFSGVVGPIYGVDWWGVWARTDDPHCGPCFEVDPVFAIRFYEDVDGVPGDLVREYTVTADWGPTGITTPDGIELQRFSVDLLQPACNLSEGWLSIQGIGQETGCRFMWGTSEDGDNRSYRLLPFFGQSPRDLAYCLDGDYEPVFGACCDDATGICSDDVERIDCYGRFEAGSDCTELSPLCGETGGACCYGDGTCEITSEAACTGTWLGGDTTCDECPCVLSRPADAVDEAEVCGVRANDGCHLSPASFNPVTPGVPVWGTLWASGGMRDTDWYEIVTTESTVFTWTVESEVESLPVLCGLIPTSPLGTPDCETVSVVSPFAYGGACEPISVTTPCLPAGTYWFYVAAVGVEGVPCGAGNHYIATLTAEPCVVMGACCYNDGYDCADVSEAECDALSGLWSAYETCAEHVCLTPCPEAAIDVELLTDDYPGETTWTIKDSLTEEVIASGGPYYEWGHLYIERICVPADRCFTFTIYDAWNNGLCCYAGQGYYRVYYQGALVRSGARFGSEESCDMGAGCPERSWACCVAGECVGDMTEAECSALSGTWIEEARCADGYDCTGEVDFRLVAPVVNVEGNTCSADNDCPLRYSEDVEYLISVPEDGLWAFSLCGSFWAFDSAIYVGQTRCGDEIGSGEDYCSTHPQFVADIAAGEYYVTVEGAAGLECGPYLLNVRKFDECDGECPPDGTPEGEPDCYDEYEDTTNGGCDAILPVFMPITEGEAICGTSGTYSVSGEDVVDADWYEFELFGPATLKWEVCATFDVDVHISSSWMYDCSDAYEVASAYGPANTTIATGAHVTSGIYWLRVAPRNTTGVPCGSSYVAKLTVERPSNVGACCHFGGCITLIDEDECTYGWGGEWYPGETCVEDGGEFTCPGGSGGACCTIDGFCITLQSEFECYEFFQGSWFEGETCMEEGGSFMCPGGSSGACCTFDGFCMMVPDEFECVVLMEGTWYEGETCVDDGGDFVCPMGAGWCDLDGDTDVDYDDYAMFLAAFGGPVDGDPPHDFACDYDGSGAVGLTDYDAWLACYREFVGDPFAAPPSDPGASDDELSTSRDARTKRVPSSGLAGDEEIRSGESRDDASQHETKASPASSGLTRKAR